LESVAVCYTDARKKVPERHSGLLPSEKELPEQCSITKIPCLSVYNVIITIPQNIYRIPFGCLDGTELTMDYLVQWLWWASRHGDQPTLCPLGKCPNFSREHSQGVIYT
jgi:hypothetical protein